MQSRGQNMMVFQSSKDKGESCMSNLAKKVVQTKHHVNGNKRKGQLIMPKLLWSFAMADWQADGELSVF